jgi:hypothetical protein
MCQDISQSIEIRASRFDQPNGRGLNDRHLRRDDHSIAHGVAFCAAMGIAAIILFPYYPKIQDRTDTASDAFGAFLTLCVIFGGLGPLVTLGLFAAQRLVRRRSASQPRERTLAP